MRRQVAVYLRLSQEDVDKRTSQVKDVSDSIVSQRLLIGRYLDELPDLRGLPRLEFCDDGSTGTNFQRPAFQRMIDLARRGEICCIAVKDLSRFGRDYLEVGDYLEHIFPFLGIRFLSVNDRYDSEAHRGRTIGMDVAFRNLVYDYYSKDLSKKVKSAMEVRQRACAYVNQAPFGYKVLPGQKHHLAIDERTAPVVRRIYAEVIGGKSCTAVAKELNAEGVPTPAEVKGGARRSPASVPQWTHRSVLHILSDLRYTGTMVNHTRESRSIRDRTQRRVPREEWYIRKNAHEAIVSAAEQEAAMAAVRRRRGGPRTAHDRSDRVYYCAHCGGKLEKANGTVFACPSHRYHDGSPCERVHWRKSALEEVLLEALKRQIQIVAVQPPEQRREAGEGDSGLRSRLFGLEAQLDSLDREKLRQYEAYREGGLTQEQYAAARDALTARRRALEEEITACQARLERSQEAEKCAAGTRDKMRQLGGLSDGQLKVHLYDAVERVLVYDGESIEIVWKFRAPDVSPLGAADNK